MADRSAAEQRDDASSALRVKRVQPAYQQVADQLNARIIDGSVAAGDRLPTEVELSEIFGVSRSTVREALRVLTSRGLLRTTRGTTGGTFVARVEFDQVSDYLETSIGLMSGSPELPVANILEARQAFEVPAAGLAALRRTEHHLEALREAVEREKRSRAVQARSREHRTFHGIVLDATQNPLIGLMTEPLFRVLSSRNPAEMPKSYWQQVDADHVEITERIAAQDHDGAIDAMRRHLETVRKDYERHA
ncbi:MAG TPA: FCD domain-containing protein [Marmoricola sp.]|jgi:DNA-binding FadR family transcriptional regulator|nr:FCD domain-containing protein [Marmoricola sp.]